MRFRRVTAGIAAVVGALALVACGASSANPAASKPVRTASGAPSAPGAVPDLVAQLLTVADLPSGWVPALVPRATGAKPPCLQNLNTGIRPSSRARASFAMGGQLPMLEEQVSYYGTSARAATALAAGAKVLDRCGAISFTHGGDHYSGTMTTLSFPKMGARSAAWRIVLSVQGFTVAMDVVVVQKGSELTLLFYGNLGTVNIDAFTAIVRTAIAKLSGGLTAA